MTVKDMGVAAGIFLLTADIQICDVLLYSKIYRDWTEQVPLKASGATTNLSSWQMGSDARHLSPADHAGRAICSRAEMRSPVAFHEAHSLPWAPPFSQASPPTPPLTEHEATPLCTSSHDTLKTLLLLLRFYCCKFHSIKLWIQQRESETREHQK